MPDPASPPPPQQEPGARRQATFPQVAAAVFWSFFGVRRKAAGERDMVTIKPVQVVIAGIVGAAMLVGLLILLVRFITHQA